MRAIAILILPAAFGALAASPPADPQATVAQQKKQIQTHLKEAELTGSPIVESAHLLLCGTLAETKLRSLAATLEKQYSVAVKALQFEKGEQPWNGKLAVYVFPDRGEYRSFVRTVEKRSPDDGEQSSQSLSGDAPHIAVGPGRSADATPVDRQAAQEVAAAILAGRAKATPLPEWVVVGFARATAARAAGQAGGIRKKGARDLLRARLRPRDAWNGEVPHEQRMILAASIMDFFAYGGGAAKPAEFLAGFRPDDEKPMKSGEDALAAIKLHVDQFELAFVRWLNSAK